MAKRDRAWRDYSDRFRQVVLPQLLRSAVLISVADNIEEIDDATIQAGTELGIALMLDKPLILLVPAGVSAPAGLARAAVAVLEDFDVDDPACQNRLSAILEGLRGDP